MKQGAHAILRAWNSSGYTQKNIADYFSIHYSRVSKIIKKAKLDPPPLIC
ncbi:MAG: hypothetical protein KAH20_01955 [Methylococcales bacterium]|nr:hypothetical protein [Methylococcales bacterium]